MPSTVIDRAPSVSRTSENTASWLRRHPVARSAAVIRYPLPPPETDSARVTARTAQSDVSGASGNRAGLRHPGCQGG